MTQPGWDSREYGTPPREKRHLKKWHLALILVGLLFLVVILFGGHSGTTGSTQTATSDTTAITYSVTGTEASTITYTTDGLTSQEQQSDVKLPFTKTINVPSTGLVVASVMAQNSGGGSITCTITDGAGHVLKQATSTGQYAIASCSGRIS